MAKSFCVSLSKPAKMPTGNNQFKAIKAVITMRRMRDSPQL
jgi:hypothetical protein